MDAPVEQNICKIAMKYAKDCVQLYADRRGDKALERITLKLQKDIRTQLLRITDPIDSFVKEMENELPDNLKEAIKLLGKVKESK